MSIEGYITNHLNGISDSMKSLPENTNKLVSSLILTKNKIFFTGVGKNGHVASKAASTFNSLNTKAIYINPVDAVHGDLGLVEENDIIVAISKSGNTDELICFLENAYKRTTNIWLIHSNPGNKCVKYCIDNIYIPVLKEADIVIGVPTVSIVVYTIFLQSIACYLAEINHISISEFVKNHPGGSLGKLK
jgi:arabinose-5-phosphate isomerase